MSILPRTLVGTVVLALLSFGLIPMAIVSLLALTVSQQATEQANAQLAIAAQNIADKIDRNLFERYGDVQAFALNDVVTRGDQWYVAGEDSAIVRTMDRLVDTYDVYALTILVDLDGRVVAVNSRDADGREIDTRALYAKNFSSAPWFTALRAGRYTTEMPFTAPENRGSTGTFVEDLHLDEDVAAVYGDEGLTLGFSAPVYVDGQLVGYWSNRAKFGLVEDIMATEWAAVASQQCRPRS